jgi:hypothetical protein
LLVHLFFGASLFFENKGKRKGGKTLNGLFGSIEYFEKEMLSFAKRRSYSEMAREHVMEIHSKIEDELVNDFICDDKIKKQCLENLNIASQKFLDKQLILL